MHINIDKIKLGTVTRHFLQICNGVMALDACPNFVSAQYLGNELIEFDLCMNIDKIKLGIVRRLFS